jgi:SAM-dependent methyltransferase
MCVCLITYIHVTRLIYRVLKPGGMVFIRDYAVGDLAQQQFEAKPPSELKTLGENFYARGDGTRAYFFSKERLLSDWCTMAFDVDECCVVQKTVVNRKQEKTMHRRFIQAKLRKRCDTSTTTTTRCDDDDNDHVVS